MHQYIYIYIYFHQSRPYQHLITLNHPLVIILLGNSTTNHEWRISPSWGIQFESPPFKVKNNMLLNTLQNFTQIGQLTKREIQFYETCANQKNRWRLTAWTSAGRFLFHEKYEKQRFSWIRHHASLIWRLAVTNVPPGGSCCSRDPNIFFFAPANLNPFRTTLSSTNL